MLLPGSDVQGEFQVQKLLGRGGFSCVYLVTPHGEPTRFLALKVLDRKVVGDERQLRRFRQEIKLLQSIRHPNVIMAHELIESGDLIAYTMDYVEGDLLAQRMHQGTIAVTSAAEIMRQVCAGLEAIHSAGIVHRDLKPENILLTKNGQVRLFDFGVVRYIGAETLTPDGVMVGTAKYLAPEYIEVGDCDHRADIFALGAIGYEMVSGVAPFPDDGRMSTLLKRLKSQVPPLRSLAPAVPRQFATIVERAMEVRLGSRYQSAAEFRQALESWLGEVASP
ncbi:MAG: serine/threonine-protein kinase [Bdellovibrionota bacterium]|nr:MAG: serine/threonine-protein kinase [Bdellovibrionota bacterium]